MCIELGAWDKQNLNFSLVELADWGRETYAHNLSQYEGMYNEDVENSALCAQRKE
jgi:hypothetical protein